MYLWYGIFLLKQNNNMKKISLVLLTVFLALTFVPSSLRADASTTANTINASAKEDAEARAMLNRLHEIEALTKTSLSRSQKKELRKEVRGMKEKMKSMRPGIYLSVAAIIIIILLLILLL
jgi:hypothetical protein